MPKRRPDLRRAVNLDEVRDSIEKQGAGQVELCRALRVLSDELRTRFGIWSSAASEEVFDRIEKGTCNAEASQPEEESSTPTTPGQGWPKRNVRSPRAPSPTPREVSASDGDEVPHISDPLTSANFPMHAEVAAFQRQSERTERLRREVATLRKALEESATNFKKVAEDAVASAIETVEAKVSLTQLDQHAELKALIEQALDQREHLASLARDAVEHRFHTELQTLSEATNKSLQALQERVARNEEKLEQEVQYLGCRIDGVLDEIAKVDCASQERAEASAHIVSSTLADFRTGELYNQARTCRELRAVTAGVAKGVLRLAQVCGILAGCGSELKDSDPLSAELCGRGILNRINDAWAVISKGCSDTMALMLQKADELVAARFAKQIGDFDARVYHECLHLVAAHQGFKEGLELSLPSGPSKHYVRWKEEKAMFDKVPEKEVLARGPSPFRGASSVLSTTCPTEPAQTPHTPLLEPHTPPYVARQRPRNLERPGSAQLRGSTRFSIGERPASTN